MGSRERLDIYSTKFTNNTLKFSLHECRSSLSRITLSPHVIIVFYYFFVLILLVCYKIFSFARLIISPTFFAARNNCYQSASCVSTLASPKIKLPKLNLSNNLKLKVKMTTNIPFHNHWWFFILLDATFRIIVRISNLKHVWLWCNWSLITPNHFLNTLDSFLLLFLLLFFSSNFNMVRKCMGPIFFLSMIVLPNRFHHQQLWCCLHLLVLISYLDAENWYYEINFTKSW